MGTFRGEPDVGVDSLGNAVNEAEVYKDAAAASASAASSSASSASSSASAASTSASNAATSESNASTSESNASTSETNAAASESTASTAASNASTSETNAAASASSASTSATNAAASETAAAASAADAATNKQNIPARNCVVNQAPLSQGESTRAGMETLDGTATSGVDITTGDFGGLRWTKDRINATSHVVSDSVRGDFYLSTNSNGAQVATVPAIDANDITWTWQTTKKKTGLTNHGSSYTTHFNPDTNFSITGFTGDTIDGLEIPHHLPVKPELIITKSLTAGLEWPVHSSLYEKDGYVYLNQTAAKTTNSTLSIISDEFTNRLGTNAQINSAVNYIQYNFASKSGVCAIKKFNGTGAAGNYVSSEVDGGDAFKPQLAIVKDLTGAGNWYLFDSIRGNTLYLIPNLSNADGTSPTYNISFVNNGIFLEGSGSEVNALNHEFLVMMLAESSNDTIKALTNYDYATTPDTLEIAENTLVSIANGFNANGQIDTQYQFGAGVTATYGAGHENKHYYVYTDKLGNLGVSETRPLKGLTRQDSDRYGEQSPTDALALDANSRTTAKHFDYESPTGVALASGETTNEYAWRAFNKDTNDISVTNQSYWAINSTTTSWLQYKGTEKRIIKSWGVREGLDVSMTPKRFTIEGSNDGLNWTEIDATYKATTGIDYVGNGANLWGDLHDVSSNTTAYDYYRINITSNNGHVTFTSIAELEFNTVLATDYYLVNEGVMYNSSDTAIERTYLGEFKTDSAGDILNETIINYPVAKPELNELAVHGDAAFYGNINNWGIATVIGYIDSLKNPPLIKSENNIANVVDLGTGVFKIIFKKPMDNLGYSVFINSEEIGRIGSVKASTGKTLNSVTIHINTYTGTYEDQVFDIIIFGGREVL